jgi:hypothetical protein
VLCGARRLVSILARPIAIAGLAFALAGSAMAASNPKTLVLKLQDMPTGFKLGKSYAVPIAKAARGDHLPVKELKHWGYLRGFEADFTRNVSLSDLVKGAIDIDSSVSAYKSSAGARASFAFSSKSCGKPPTTKLSVGAKIGDDAVLCAFVRKSKGYKVETYALVWQRGALKAAVIIAGLKGGTSPDQAVHLAKIQDRRMR